jgi:hypothetical protein
VSAPVPGAGTDPVSVLAGSLEQHDAEWIDHEVGWECGCNEHGTCEPLPNILTLHAHRSRAALTALREAGYVVVPAERIADLERRNANLGRLAAGGAPAGYALVRAEDVL